MATTPRPVPRHLQEQLHAELNALHDAITRALWHVGRDWPRVLEECRHADERHSNIDRLLGLIDASA